MNKYTLRRNLLGAVRNCEPAAATVDDVMTYPMMEMGAVRRDEAIAELSGLVAHNYLRDLCPGRAPFYRLSPQGRDQIDRETDLDEYIWGEFASKFAAKG